MLKKIKDILKKNILFYRFNAFLKEKTVKRQYQNTVDYYNRKKLDSTFDELVENRCGKRLETLRQECTYRQLHIFFLGTDEAQDRSGTIQALEKIGKVTLFHRADGSYGQNYPGTVEERLKANSDRLKNIFKNLSEKGLTPDILIGQSWAGFISGELLSEIKNKYGTIVVNIGMDDRHQYWGTELDNKWMGTYGLVPYIDLALTAAPECVDWYMKEGCPALYFPEASDPDIFYPMPDLPKIHDVSFVGGRYGVREKIVTCMVENGIQVSVYGNGWPKGRVPLEDVPALFAQSKIILGVGTIGHCEDFYALKMRDFDGPISGSLYLTHDNSDLKDLYAVGEEIITYDCIDDCLSKIKHLLKFADEREQIAKAGYLRALNEHTWTARFSTFFSRIGLM